MSKELNPNIVKYGDLYDRIVELWGNVSVDEFYEMIEEEGYWDLSTRVKITEEFYKYLENKYSSFDQSWKQKLKNMKDGFDRGLEYRIHKHKQLKNRGELNK